MTLSRLRQEAQKEREEAQKKQNAQRQTANSAAGVPADADYTVGSRLQAEALRERLDRENRSGTIAIREAVRPPASTATASTNATSRKALETQLAEAKARLKANSGYNFGTDAMYDSNAIEASRKRTQAQAEAYNDIKRIEKKLDDLDLTEKWGNKTYTEIADANGFMDEANSFRSSDMAASELRALERQKENLLKQQTILMNSKNAAADDPKLRQIREELNEIDRQALSLKKEKKTLEEYERQDLIDSGEYRDASLWDVTVNAVKQGYLNSIYGQESYKDMLGRENEKQKYEDILAGEEYRFVPGNGFEEAVSGAANLLGQQLRQWTDKRSVAGAMTGAGIALAAGQAGPQALIPEEIATVPGAFFAGMQAGSSMSNLEIEAGLAYNEMIDNGISPNVAQKIALMVGGGNAALETLQLDELVKGFRILKNSGATQSAAQRLLQLMIDKGLDIGNETLQEVLQEGVTIAGTQAANKLETGEWAYTSDEVLDRLGDTAKSSALSFGLMNVPSAGFNSYNIVQDQKKQDSAYGGAIREVYDGSVQDVIETGLASDPSTKSYKQAAALRQKIESGGTVTDAEIGRLHQENIRAIEAEERKAASAKNTQNVRGTEAAAQRTETERAVSDEGGIFPYKQKNAARSYEGPNYGENGTRTFMEIAETSDEPMSNIRMNFESAYQAGLVDTPESALSFANVEQKMAYNAGQQDRLLTLSRNKQQGVTATFESGVLLQNELSNDLDTATRDTLHKLGKATGAKIIFDESLRGGQNNGYYKNGEIHISPDAEDPVMVVVKHELTHHLQTAAPEAYVAYRDYAVRKMNEGQPYGSVTVAEAKQNRYYELSKGEVDLTTEGAMDEVAAEFTEFILGDDEKLRSFVDEISGTAETRTWGQKIFDAIHAFIEKVKGALGVKNKTIGDEVAMKKYGVTMQQLEKAEKLWKDAVREAVKATKNAAHADGGVNAAESVKGNGFQTMFKMKDSEADSVKEQLRAHISELNAVDAVANVTVPTSFGNTMDDARKWIVNQLKSTGYQVDRKGFGTIVFDEKRLNTSLNYIDSKAEIAAYAVLPRVLKRGIEVGRHVDHKGRAYGTVTFAAPVILNGKRGNMAVVVKMTNQNWYKIHRILMPDGTAYELESTKKTEPTPAWGVTKTGSLATPISSADAIVTQKGNTVKSEAAEMSDRDVKYSLRKKDPPKKIGIAYKVFLAKDGELFPPMVANPGGEGTPVGVWLDADIGKQAPPSKTGRPQVQGGGKGTNSGKISLAFRPGWHLGDIPLAKQFAKLNKETGKKELFPYNFVWAECEYAMDVDYREEAMSYGYTENGKFRHSYAGLPKLPEDGYYRYRTNPNPDTVPWIITGAMRVKKVLTDAETDAICRENGVEPMAREGGPIDLAKFGIKAGDQVKHSLKDQNDLMRENAKLKAVNQALREQFKTTKFAKVDKKALDSFAKKLLRDYQSGADIDDTRMALDDLYTYIANGEDGEGATWEAAYRKAFDAAMNILQNVSVVNDDLYREYKELRDRLRTTGITLDRQYTDSLVGYAGISEFRKKYFGRIKLVKDGLPVDVAYEELASDYPGLFDAYEYTNPADQLLNIAEVLDSLQPYEENPYSYNMRESASWLANDIMERFFELPQAKPTFADKAERNLTETKIKDQKKLDKLREQKNARIAEIIAENREKVKRVQEKERQKRAEAVAETKEHYAAKEARMSESRKASVLRKRITRHAADLSQKLLRPSDKQHIPEDLRGTVAALLESINLESQYTIDPVTGKRQKNGGGEPVKRTQLFQDLKKQYMRISQESSMVVDPALLGDEETQGWFEQVIALGETRVADMNLEELNILWSVMRSVEHSITTANKVLSKAKFQKTTEWANAIQEETSTRRAMKGRKLEEIRMDLENPYTFFSHYGEAGHAIYRMLRNAQDHQQIMTTALQSEVEKIVDPKTVGNLEKETHEFTTERGEKLTLTTAHIMEIHELMKREQARDHLTKGGIVQPEIESAKIKRGTDSVLLTLDDLSSIVGTLTDEQVQIADALQKLTSTMLAAYGNEASMKAYGYKKFTGTDYWPIKSAREGVHSNIEKGNTNTRSIKNIGLAKSVIPHANNPLDIGGVFRTFSSHAADMIDYAAWLCPMEDANRLYNYEFRGIDGSRTGKTMKGLLDRVGGKGAQQYWFRLMEDIQNGIKPASDTWYGKAVDKIVGNVKGAAVGANIRVVIQQPTAIVRAAAVLSPADMAKGLVSGGGWKAAMEHSAIAQRKDMGGFDIGSPMQMSEILFDTRTGLRKFNDKLSAPAGAADAVTWGRIWNACEWAVKREQPSLKAGSEDFYAAVDELFTEVIDQTQVVDGVLQRAQVMRSGNAVVKQATAFMGEPTMSLNMVLRAYDEWRGQTDKAKRSAALKKISKTIIVLVATNAVNALAQSLIDAERDDDDEKKYWERVWAAFTGLSGEEESMWEKATAAVLNGNLGSGLNPLTYMPGTKDIISIFSGYDVTRMDADVMADIIKSGKTFAESISGSGKKTPAAALKEFAHNIARACGISATNIIRDAWGIYRSIAIETDNIGLLYEITKAEYNIGFESNSGKFIDLLYRAYTSDKTAYEKIYADMVESGIDPEKIKNGMETRMKKDQGVKKVEDLAERYLPPEQKNRYDRSISSMDKSSVWRSATDAQRGEIEADLHDLITESDAGKALQEKIDEGAAWGVDESEYLLYKLALDMVDQPNKSGEYGGTPTNEEKAAAIAKLDGLRDSEIAYLWDTEDGYDAFANGIDMRSYVEYVGDGGGVSIEKIISAKEAGIEEDTYFDFLDMLNEYDQPTESGKYGSFTQAEAAAAVAAVPGLTNEERAYLWQSVNKSWKPDKNPWK